MSQKYIFVEIWYLNNKINYILELNKNKPILHIVMYSDTYGQIYLFTKILIELFQCKYIWTFIWDVFVCKKIHSDIIARYCVHTTATWDQFWNIFKKVWWVFVVSLWLIKSRLKNKIVWNITHHTKHILKKFDKYLLTIQKTYVKFKIGQANHFKVKKGTLWKKKSRKIKTLVIF